jgi:hypothetical protein
MADESKRKGYQYSDEELNEIESEQNETEE